jgi:uncharacterized protein
MKKPKSRYYARNLILIGLGEFLMVALAVCYGILPYRYAAEIAYPIRAPLTGRTPMDLGLPFRDVYFQTNDHIRLSGWFIPGSNRAAVIVAHAAGANRESMLERGAVLARHGYSILLLDLRAQGESEGGKISFGGEDVLAAVEFLKKQPEVDPGRIGALGSSLGSMVAVQAAAVSPEIKAVVVDSGALVNFEDEPSPVSLPHLLNLQYQWVTMNIWKWEKVAAPLPMV